MNTPTPTALRITARVLTGSTNAILGWDTARTPGDRVAQAASTLATMRKVIPLPKNDTLVVRANGAIQAGAGAVLAL